MSTRRFSPFSTRIEANNDSIGLSNKIRTREGGSPSVALSRGSERSMKACAQARCCQGTKTIAIHSTKRHASVVSQKFIEKFQTMAVAEWRHANPPESPFSKGGISSVGSKPLFWKRGEGEIFGGTVRELCSELLGQDTRCIPCLRATGRSPLALMKATI